MNKCDIIVPRRYKYKFEFNKFANEEFRPQGSIYDITGIVTAAEAAKLTDIHTINARINTLLGREEYTIDETTRFYRMLSDTQECICVHTDYINYNESKIHQHRKVVHTSITPSTLGDNSCRHYARINTLKSRFNVKLEINRPRLTYCTDDTKSFRFEVLSPTILEEKYYKHIFTYITGGVSIDWYTTTVEYVNV